MGRKKSSKIWEPSKKEFQEIMDNASTYCDVLRHFGFDPYKGNHRTIKKRIEEDNVDLTKFNENHKKHLENIVKKRKISNKDIFVKNSTYNHNANLKKRIINNNLIDYKCSNCKNTGHWQGSVLSLQLDHINGINNDNRIENLRFLCPNCHSQTSTYAGKRHKKYNICKKCEKSTRSKTSYYCEGCRKIRQEESCHKKKFDPSKEELSRIIKEFDYNISKTARYFGVSGTAVKKRIKKFNVDWKAPTQT